jgi:hypothetical protein
MFTIDVLSPLMALLSLVAVHIFLPFQCAKEGWLAIRTKAIGPEAVLYLNLALVIGYCFLVFVLVEHGENMRFRLSIEPVIWLCMLLMLTATVRRAARLRDRFIR